MTVPSLSEYLKDPLAFPRAMASPVWGVRTRRAFSGFFGFYCPTPLLWRRMKKTVEALAFDGVIPRRPLRLSFSLKAFAYARDYGEITFSLGALLSRSAPVTLSVLCHEVAHVWLSTVPEYEGIKALDRTFRETFACELCRPRLYAPIEIYTMHLSLRLMDAALCAAREMRVRKKKKFERIVKDEERKLVSLLDHIDLLLTAKPNE